MSVNGENKLQHICPACNKRWTCDCTDEVKSLHVRGMGAHFPEIACSMECAQHLRALLIFLERMGV